MVLNTTYQDVSKDWVHDFEKDGVTLEAAMDYLGDAGFAIIHKRSHCYLHKDDNRKEMLKPFAPIHILRVMPSFDSPHGHVVVMDAKGKIFCPGGFTETEIQQAYSIVDTVGLYKTK